MVKIYIDKGISKMLWAHLVSKHENDLDIRKQLETSR